MNRPACGMNGTTHVALKGAAVYLSVDFFFPPVQSRMPATRTEYGWIFCASQNSEAFLGVLIIKTKRS